MMSKKCFIPFSEDMEFSEIDHIIIGSGIGGLTAATWLAKAGKKVVVFESHYVPGGFTHSFKRKQGFNWDVGVHYVGNIGKGTSLRRSFDFISDNKLNWESMGEVYDVVQIADKSYEILAGKDNFRNQMIRYFPDEIKAIITYLDLIEKSNRRGNFFFIEKIFKPFLSNTLGKIIRKRYALYSQRTTLEVLNEITQNKRLIAVLCSQCGNYGLSPNYSSFAVHALVIGHFLEGAYYPIGGSDQISIKIIEHLNSLNCKVYTNAPVSEIVLENNKVIGIKINDRFIACSSIISNAGVNNTFSKLLDSRTNIYNGIDLKNLKPSTGHICLYIGLNKSDEYLKLSKHNVWFYENENIDAIFNEVTKENTGKNFVYISFPSAKDPKWNEKHPNQATIQMISAADYSWFLEYENQPWMKRDDAYKHFKETYKMNMLEKLYQLFPQIKGHVSVTEVSTPLSTKHFSNYQNGEIYGLEHTPKRFNLPFLRPETKIKGLRLVGQDITIVGVAGAMLSGMLAAITILKFRVWPLFRQMK